MERKGYIESTLNKEDRTFEIPLRPSFLDEFIGQDLIRDRLGVLLGAAKQRKEPLSHCLFSGPPGLGKTTLSYIVAKELGCNLVVTSGPAIDKAGDLAGLLTNLQSGDVLFIDEIHRLNRTVEEYLYSAMEDFRLELMIDSGPNARSVQVNLNPFTLIGATTRLGLITAPLRSRFGAMLRLDYYPTDALQKILLRTAQLLHLKVDMQGILEIANRSRGTPRIANHLLRWVRDYSQMRAKNVFSQEVVKSALEMLNIDSKGLDEMDKKILDIMIDFHGGGPVGLNTIAVAAGEESHTIEEVYEPYLIQLGFIKRTPKGREATLLAYEHMEKKFD